MNKKMLYFGLLACFVIVMGATSVSAKQPENVGREFGEQHRSDVAKVVKELEKVADRDNNIGDEVREVAQDEKELSETIKEKMDNVEKRSGFKIFLIGSDYKNLGALKSKLVTTQNHLNRLNKSLERAATDEVKADLETQIYELDEIKTRAESFVVENESKFSLFGWFVKLFNK